jgi:hypothetical protein
MKLDSEEQREYLIGVLREVPVQIKDGNGKPTTLATVATLEDGPPEPMKALLRAIRSAVIEVHQVGYTPEVYT